jgi:two-component system sensor kinase FixL
MPASGALGWAPDSPAQDGQEAEQTIVEEISQADARNSPRWQNDTLFHVLMATAVDGVVFFDADRMLRLYNPICERMFGYTADEMLGKSVMTLMPEFCHKAFDAALAGAGAAPECELAGRRKDGAIFPMGLSVRPGVLGEATIFVGRLRDLTASKQEAARREGDNRFLAQIVRSSDDAIISKTLDGMITSWNPAAARIFGYGADEVIGRHISLLIPADRRAEEDEIIAQLKAGGDIDHYETVRLRKTGAEILVSLSVSPLRDSRGVIVGATKVARDITERKRSAARLESLQSELAHVARLNAMGQMSAALAHELNQPLTAIANYASAALRGLQTGDPQKLPGAVEAMTKAVAQTLRAGQIIRHLRQFVEKREGERTLHDLNQVVEEAMALGLAGAPGNVAVSLTLTAEPLPVLMDRIQIQQVQLNLVRNALEAMAPQRTGRLTVTTRREEAFAVLTVQDNGPGLPPDIAATLFQPFVTTKAQGMGIGLSVCRSILDAHGGHIAWLPGAPGSGTVFELRLPLHQTASP